MGNGSSTGAGDTAGAQRVAYLTLDELQALIAMPTHQLTPSVVGRLGIRPSRVVKAALQNGLPSQIQAEVLSVSGNWWSEVSQVRLEMEGEHQRRVEALLTAISDQLPQMVRLLMELVGQGQAAAARTQEPPRPVRQDSGRPPSRPR